MRYNRIETEISEKIVIGIETHYIIECNGYYDDEYTVQFSRTPFVFTDLTDQQVIDLVKENYYFIYT